MKRLHKKTALMAAVVILTILLVVIAVLAVTVGPVPVPVEKVLAVLKDVLFHQTTPDAYSQSQYHIIWNIRMPRIVMIDMCHCFVKAVDSFHRNDRI